MEIPALVELIRYQELVTETAKAIYRRSNPEAGRLPNRFEEMATLRFSRIEAGSAAIPLEACEEYDESAFEFAQDQPIVPVREAVDLIASSVKAAERNEKLPEEFPRACLAPLAALGKTLGPEDRIGMESARNKVSAWYTQQVRNHFEALVTAPYTDTDVRVKGKVLAADVKAFRFVLYPEDQSPVQVLFDEAQEAEVIRALKEHRSRMLFVRGQGEFHPDGRLKQVSGIVELRLEGEGDARLGRGGRVSEELLALAESVPEEALEGVPPDASTRLDEYLYGGRKE